MIDKKKCTRCKKEKELVLDFYMIKGKYRTECKRCTLDRSKIYNKKKQPWKDRSPEEKEKMRAYQQEYRKNNKEQVRKNQEKFMKKNPDYMKNYRKRKTDVAQSLNDTGNINKKTPLIDR